MFPVIPPRIIYTVSNKCGNLHLTCKSDIIKKKLDYKVESVHRQASSIFLQGGFLLYRSNLQKEYCYTESYYHRIGCTGVHRGA